MTTALFTHKDCLDHVTPPGHPECVARLEAVMGALDDPSFTNLDRRDAPLAEFAQIELCHPRVMIANIKALAEAAGKIPAPIDADTSIVEGSWNAALRAAGAVVAAVDAVIEGAVDNAFCAVRPPGHHAEPDQAMGFCLFNNITIGARHAQAQHGLNKIAIIDFDVHHGNGTEAICAHDGTLFYGSTHQVPHYPGTGDPSFTGVGNVVNRALAPGAGGIEFRQAMERDILPALQSFDPDMIMISAGFDAHRADPLSHINLTEEDYVWITSKLGEIAQKQCRGRIVSSLEGGYDLGALGTSTAAHVHELMSMAT